MLVACAWCKRVIGERGEPSLAECRITHGICEACAQLVEEYEPVQLCKVLDRFQGPVLLVDAEGRVVAGNANAAAILGKEQVSFCGQLSGEVIECIHSYEQRGCGRTMHCTGCTIRNAVKHTSATGESCLGVEAHQHVFTLLGVEHKRVLITTERWRGRVLLRIDAIEPYGVA